MNGVLKVLSVWIDDIVRTEKKNIEIRFIGKFGLFWVGMNIDFEFNWRPLEFQTIYMFGSCTFFWNLIILVFDYFGVHQTSYTFSWFSLKSNCILIAFAQKLVCVFDYNTLTSVICLQLVSPKLIGAIAIATTKSKTKTRNCFETSSVGFSKHLHWFLYALLPLDKLLCAVLYVVHSCKYIRTKCHRHHLNR